MGKNIFDVLEDNLVEDEEEMTYMDAITLKMTPFPYYMHEHVNEVDQVFPLL